MQLRLNEDELSAMDGAPLLPRCVYVFGIRPYMDYATGLVGRKRGISYQSIAEACYVEHHQGRQDSGTPHRSSIRRAVAYLEQIGLIRNVSEGKQLVFDCLLATTDQSVSNKPDRRPTHLRHTEADTEPGREGDTKPDTPKPSADGGFPEKPDTEHDRQPDTEPGRRPTHPETSKPDTPPGSGIRKEGSRESGGNRSRQRSLPDGDETPPARRGREPSQEDYRLAQWMHDKILELGIGFRARTEKQLLGWANDIRLMRERDGRDHRTIAELFAWANAHEFWRANILSPAKLRTQWPTLEGQRKRAGGVNRQQALEDRNRALADEIAAENEQQVGHG